VVLDWALAETLLALGHVPAGVVAASDWSRFVVAPALPEQVADLGLQQELNFELIASMRPDLILISPFLERLEPQLKRIAPTRNLSVYDPGETVLAQRIQVVKELAAVVGATARAQRWLTQVEADLQGSWERLSTLEKRPVVMASFVDNRHVRVYGGSSLYAEVLSRLGLRNGWSHEVGYFGFSTVGIERLARLGDIEFIAVERLCGVLVVLCGRLGHGKRREKNCYREEKQANRGMHRQPLQVGHQWSIMVAQAKKKRNLRIPLF